MQSTNLLNSMHTMDYAHTVADTFVCNMQLQGQHGKCDKRFSYPEVFRQIYAQRGVAGLYAGIIPEYAKVVPGVAIAFCSYEVCTVSSAATKSSFPCSSAMLCIWLKAQDFDWFGRMPQAGCPTLVPRKASYRLSCTRS